MLGCGPKDSGPLDKQTTRPLCFIVSTRLRVITRSKTWINVWDFSGFAMRNPYVHQYQIKAHPWHKVFHKRMPSEAVNLVSRLLQYSSNLQCTADNIFSTMDVSCCCGSRKVLYHIP
ncbi:hypothetical protein K1719_009162 [Acacia pycnantha]|nr:hypothetical protein K1719_009162 [Acacia pycnantha]